MNADRLKSALAQVTLVTRFYYYPEIDSTMEQARRLVSYSDALLHHGTLLIADYQTAGRGRHGRSWSAAAGQSVLASMVVALEKLPHARQPCQLSLLAAAIPVAMCRAIRRFAPGVFIKYPNDIVANGRKIGGLLLEKIGETLIIGFGINCDQDLSDLPIHLRMPASSLLLETGRKIEREEVLSAILAQVELVLGVDALDSIIAEMNQLCDTIGQAISVDTGNEVITGIAEKIAADGTLLLYTEAGPRKVFSSQIVRTWPLEAQE